MRTSNQRESQDLGTADIDPDRLAEKLKQKFPSESFEVQIVHNVYTIQAPRRLSDTDIKECTYRYQQEFSNTDKRAHLWSLSWSSGWRWLGERVASRNRKEASGSGTHVDEEVATEVVIDR